MNKSPVLATLVCGILVGNRRASTSCFAEEAVSRKPNVVPVVTDHYFDDTYFRNGKPEKFQGYCTDVWFGEALNRLADKEFPPRLPRHSKPTNPIPAKLRTNVEGSGTGQATL
jgi:hypothetical protein